MNKINQPLSICNQTNKNKLVFLLFMALSPELEAEIKKERKEIIREEIKKEMSKKSNFNKSKVDVRELTEKVKKDFEKEKEYEQNKKDIADEERNRRYSQSAQGRFGNRIKRAGGYFKRGGYSRVPSNRVVRSPYSMRPRGYIEKAQSHIPINIRRRIEGASSVAVMSPQQREFNSIFSNFNVAQGVEREIMNSAGTGVAGDGDRVARQIGRESFMFGNVLSDFNNPLVDVESEVNNHSKRGHIKSVFDVSNEALSFAHILDNPVRPHRRRRK